MSRPALAEWLLPLSLASDAGAALPAGTGLRTALIGLYLADLSPEPVARADVYFGALLRHLGCTSTAVDETRLMGDEQELRATMALADAGSPRSMLSAASRGFGSGKGPGERVRRVARFLLKAPRQVPRIFSDRCEVARHLAARLGLPAGVQQVLVEAYERFDGKGVPAGKRGHAINPAARLLAAAEMVSMCAPLPGGLGMARDLLAHRSGTQFDPAIVAALAPHWQGLAELLAGDLRAKALAREPLVAVAVDLTDSNTLALAFADFADLKSPFTVGHSRRVSALAEGAAGVLGLPVAERERLALAGLLHDLGRVSVSNAIWDKPGPLTDAEREVMRGHARATERILAEAAPWQHLALLAASDHERLDGSGYPRLTLPPNAGFAARVLAAADVFAALTEARAHRPAFAAEEAARLLRSEAARGRLDRAASDAVLASAGHLAGKARPRLPCNLSQRELEVLRLLVRGLVDKDIAKALGISHRTVHHHNQSLFGKIGVTTRGAAALFAVENGLL